MNRYPVVFPMLSLDAAGGITLTEPAPEYIALSTAFLHLVAHGFTDKARLDEGGITFFYTNGTHRYSFIELSKERRQWIARRDTRVTQADASAVSRRGDGDGAGGAGAAADDLPALLPDLVPAS